MNNYINYKEISTFVLLVTAPLSKSVYFSIKYMLLVSQGFTPKSYYGVLFHQRTINNTH